MTKITVLVLTALSLLSPISLAEEVAKTTASSTSDMAATSRLRMFGQNGASAVLFRGTACVKNFWSSDGEKASGGFGSAFSSFAGKVTNTSLGIADTDTTRNLSKKDGMFSKAYFREYQIPADKPSSMRMSFRDVSSFYVVNGIRYDAVSTSCHGAISFTPHAGQDYEAAFTWDDKVCRLAVNQVVSKDGKTELVPVAVTPASDCDAATAN